MESILRCWDAIAKIRHDGVGTLLQHLVSRLPEAISGDFQCPAITKCVPSEVRIYIELYQKFLT